MPSKLRATRRRGRAPHASDSDDEIVRASTSDSDGTNDSLDDSSESDDEESDSEPVSRHLTPNTSHSPDADPDEKPAPFFSATPAAWADMVDEAAGLPVISFGELDAHAVRKVRMQEPEQPAAESDDDDQQPVASSSRHSPAPRAPPPPSSSFVRSQSARQAYQHRLDSDPSFVPVVGEFWGHDDRLLDKDLRSLSGWWRGRWQGRGRGGVFPPRGRGRGGFNSGSGPTPNQPGAPEPTPAPESPMDRPWTHDGFEEMRRREDNNRARPHPPPPPPPSSSTPAWRTNQAPPPTRGAHAPAFRARGGGLHPHANRPWYAMKPEHPWTKQHDAFLYLDPALRPRPGHPAALRVRLPGGAPAVIVRAATRGMGPRAARAVVKVLAREGEYVVKLPGPVPLPEPRAGKGRAGAPALAPKPSSRKDSSVAEADAFTVKLPPPPAAKANADAEASLKPDADGWVRPDAAAAALAASLSPPPVPLPLPNTLNTLSSPPVLSPPSLPNNVLPSTNPTALPPQAQFWAPHPQAFAFPPPPPPPSGPGAGQGLPIGFSAPPGFPGPPHFGGHSHTPSLSFGGAVPGFPAQAQIGGTPPPGFIPAQMGTPPPGFGIGIGTPPFGAPQALPGYGGMGMGMGLPPGVALDARGMPFEVASGRAVFLQPQPQPQQGWGGYGGHQHAQSMSMGGGMGMGMMGGGGGGMHAHGMSMSGMADPSLFAFARPGRVEIRAPGAGKQPSPLSPLSPSPREKEGGGNTPANGDAETGDEAKRRLRLRTGAAAFVPAHASAASMSTSAAIFTPASALAAPVSPAGPSANAGEEGAGAYGYDNAGYGAYVPTQYYYPHPAYYPVDAQQQQQEGAYY
ncbi:hypothetical protein B0H11DRAFT_2359450 [Mycena galericulata]|nr:hypothetical protein B0H11DRAFT_2359450 [Mycena galericulata]